MELPQPHIVVGDPFFEQRTRMVTMMNFINTHNFIVHHTRKNYKTLTWNGRRRLRRMLHHLAREVGRM